MNDKEIDHNYQRTTSSKMKKGFIEIQPVEVDHLNSLQDIQSNFSVTHDSQKWEQKVASQIGTHLSDDLQQKFSLTKGTSNCHTNFVSEFVEENHEFSERVGNSCVNQRFSSFPIKQASELYNQKHMLPKNDQPSLFVHENFFKKQASHNSQAACKKTTNSVSKIQASRSFQSVTTQSFSSSSCFTKSTNGNISSKTCELRNAQFKAEVSAFQQALTPSENRIASDSNIPHVTGIGSHQFVSRRSFEFFGCSNIYKFNSERLTQLCQMGYESISESDDDEDDEASEEISFTSREPITYHSLNSSDPTVNGDSSGLLAIEYDLKKDKIHHMLTKIALELLTTERTYVGILHLLDQVFAFRVDQENRAHNMFPQDVVSQMFTNLKSLYKLHHDFLLPQLEERMDDWEKDCRIGDIMKNFAPFLKMYTEYVKNYDNAMNLINTWYQKNPRFAQIMDELHSSEECKLLTLQHHMLTPVQRVPRYQLLLNDYLKKLPDDSLDKSDTEKALELVSIAANHSNETMKKIDKFKKLLEIQEMIGGVVDLVSPSRELLKEGKIVKISARSGDHQERYLFLFSDLVLLCSQRLIPNKVVSGPCYRVRARLEVENLLIEEGDNLETANTFYIRTTGRVIELYTPTREGKAEWIQALTNAVSDLLQKKSSLKVGNQEAKNQDAVELGTKAPKFVKVDTITHCMACDSLFSTFTFRRKHHCHACGIVACNKCLPHKVQLPYEGHKQGRVCNNCYSILVKELKEDRPRHVDSPQRQKGILDVNPNDPSVVSGYLQLKARSRFWVRRWFTLHDDFVLYSFNSHVDEVALTSMPVPGFTVGMPDKGDIVDGRENVFKLYHKKKVYFFQTADSSELQRWVLALEKASKAENNTS